MEVQIVFKLDRNSSSFCTSKINKNNRFQKKLLSVECKETTKLNKLKYIRSVIYSPFSVDFTTVHVKGTGGRSAKNGVAFIFFLILGFFIY